MEAGDILFVLLAVSFKCFLFQFFGRSSPVRELLVLSYRSPRPWLQCSAPFHLAPSRSYSGCRTMRLESYSKYQNDCMPSHQWRNCIGCRWSSASRISWRRRCWLSGFEARQRPTPAYLSERIVACSSTRLLHSSSILLLQTPFIRTSFGKRASSRATPFSRVGIPKK